MSSLQEAPTDSKIKPRIVSMKSDGLKVDLVLRGKDVSGLDIDYQAASSESSFKEVLLMVEDLISANLGTTTQAVPRMVTNLAGRGVKPKAPAKKSAPKQVLPKKQEDAPDYSKAIMDAVDKGMSILGQQGKETTLALLERRFGLKLQDIPAHPRGFMELLEETLGNAAIAVEKEIVSELKRTSPSAASIFEYFIESMKEGGAREPEGQPAPETPAPTEESKQQETTAVSGPYTLNLVIEPKPVPFRFYYSKSASR